MTSAEPDTLELLRDQAATGAPEALYGLAAELVNRQQMEDAFALHARAAQAGFAPAQIELARMHLFGVGTDFDPAGAVQWLERAEAGGHPVAGYYLALIAVGGVAVMRDMRINARVLAAVNAQFPPTLRAAALHFGRKPHADDQRRCLQLLEQAAARGDALCAQLLVERLQKGEGCDIDQPGAEDLRQQLQASGLTKLPAVSADPPAAQPTPAGVLALEDMFVAAPARMLAETPRIGQVDGLLSADECRLLIASAQPMLKRSQTLDPETGEPVALELRTSQDASFDPVMGDLALRMIQMRIAAAAGVELVQCEQLIVLRYAPGEEYRPHRDYLPPETVERDGPQAGNRARSICVYLNDVEAGGATEFPKAGVTVQPKAGRAVVFDNLREDGSPEPDSLHAGLPVERGEKWLATLWIRQGQYRAW